MTTVFNQSKALHKHSQQSNSHTCSKVTHVLHTSHAPQASFDEHKRMALEGPERKKRNMALWKAKARVIGHFGMLEHLKRAQLGGIELNILDINHVR